MERREAQDDPDEKCSERPPLNPALKAERPVDQRASTQLSKSMSISCSRRVMGPLKPDYVTPASGVVRMKMCISSLFLRIWANDPEHHMAVR